MKRMITLFMVAAIATTSCKKDKGVDCLAAANKMQKAAETYFNSDTKENCDAYKAAMQEYINSSCFSSLSQEQKNSLQQDIDDTNCAD